MDRSLGLALIGAAFVLSPEALCEDSFAEQDSRLRITVRVFNYARLPDNELRRATDFATAVFQRAGVGVVWVQCRTSLEHAKSNPECGDAVSHTDLLLNILTGSMSLRMGVRDTCFGYALHMTNGLSRLAGVDAYRALALERQAKVPRPIILGIFMAHEIGHLLLADSSHSVGGVMRASWSPSSLRRAAGGIVGFSPRQAEFLRTNVRKRAQANSR